tara:strand:- start:947 stop:1111 length:165 start_codon:yes stop_codon:yes gene_type:complete
MELVNKSKCPILGGHYCYAGQCRYYDDGKCTAKTPRKAAVRLLHKKGKPESGGR